MIEVNYLVRNRQTGEEVSRGNGKFESTEHAFACLYFRYDKNLYSASLHGGRYCK